MKTEAALLEKIVAAPEEESTRLVYADWLEERGDPRAEYLRTELALARTGDAALRRRLRAARAKIDRAWLAVLDQPRVMRANPTPFPATWWSIGLGDRRPVDATYGSWSYASLPPLAAGSTAGFEAMKRAAAPELRRKPEWAPVLADVDRIERGATERGLALPPSFRSFFATFELPVKLRSCTACWFSFGDFVPSPGDDGAFLVRFYSDQQSCLHWYLHLTPEGSHCVVSGVEPFEDEDEEWLDEEEEEDGEEDGDADPEEAAARAAELLRAIEAPAAVPAPDPSAPAAVTQACFAAPSFESFLHRFWFENEIWYALNLDKTPLTDEQRAYLDHYR